MEHGRFTAEELRVAKDTDLCDVAKQLGYTVRRIGRYHTLEEMDSLRIYNRKSWFRWSKAHEGGERGGSQIDFLKAFAGMDIREAVFWLLDFAGYNRGGYGTGECGLEHRISRESGRRKQKLVLPAPASDNRHLYIYLAEERGISKETIDYFVESGLIYEAAGYHNIVFRGNDKDGNTRFASMRGTSDKNGKGFRCDVAGSDKNYGFHLFRSGSGGVAVFEAAIDAMSYMDMFRDDKGSLLALGMLWDAPLATFLSEYPQIHSIRFCLDNDGAGRETTEKLMQKYYELGYDVEDRPPPKGCKDYNQWLQEAAKSRQREAAGEPGRQRPRAR